MANPNQTRGGYPDNPGQYSPDSSRRFEVAVPEYNPNEGMTFDEVYDSWEYPPIFETADECRAFWQQVKIPPRAVSHIHNGLKSLYNKKRTEFFEEYSHTHPMPLRTDPNFEKFDREWQAGASAAYDAAVAAGRAMPKLTKRAAPHYIRAGLMCLSAWNEDNFHTGDGEQFQEVMRTDVNIPGVGVFYAGDVFKAYRFKDLDDRWLQDPDVQAAGALLDQEERYTHR